MGMSNDKAAQLLAGLNAPRMASMLDASKGLQLGIQSFRNQQAEEGNRQSMAMANEYVAGLLGKGDRDSVRQSMAMLPYANEIYGKQAENMMGDIRHSESLAQAKEISDNDFALRGQDMANRYENDAKRLLLSEKELSQAYQMHQEDMALKKFLSNNEIAASKEAAASKNALTPAQQLAFSKDMGTMTPVFWEGKDGKRHYSTTTKGHVLDMLEDANRKGGTGKYKTLNKVISTGDEAYKMFMLTKVPAKDQATIIAKDLATEQKKAGIIDRASGYLFGWE